MSTQAHRECGLVVILKGSLSHGSWGPRALWGDGREDKKSNKSKSGLQKPWSMVEGPPALPAVAGEGDPAYVVVFNLGVLQRPWKHMWNIVCTPALQDTSCFLCPPSSFAKSLCNDCCSCSLNMSDSRPRNPHFVLFYPCTFTLASLIHSTPSG